MCLSLLEKWGRVIMKILIVDDEKMIRRGIVQILSSAFPCETFLEAHNGEVALSVFHDEHPDILITDIKMPVMDGLELMKKVRAEDSKISIIVATGFDDFSYAHTALQCGASAYILKPIEKLELIETVDQIINEKKLSEKGVIECLLGRCYADGGLTRENEKRLEFLSPYSVVAILNPINISTNDIYLISPINHGYLVLVNDEKRLPELADGTYAGCSRKREGFDELSDAALEAMVALFERFVENGRLFISKGLGAISNDIPDKVSKINNQLGFSTPQEVEKNVSALFDFPPNVDRVFYLFSMAEAIKNGVLLKAINEDELLLAHLLSLYTYKNIDEWKTDLIKFLQKENEKRKNELPDNTFVSKAIAYVEENYAKNINMAVVSNEVGISYTYFSEKFKEYTKVNFNDFLTSYRVKKAKELLEKGYYRIYEVSEKCGFSGPRYFIKIFKQETGVTPTAYMTSHMKTD